GGDGSSLAASLSGGDAWFEADQREGVAVAAFAKERLGLEKELRAHGDGNPEVKDEGGYGAMKFGRRDADDGEVMTVEADGLADDGWVCAKLTPPEVVTHD